MTFGSLDGENISNFCLWFEVFRYTYVNGLLMLRFVVQNLPGSDNKNKDSVREQII